MTRFDWFLMVVAGVGFVLVIAATIALDAAS